MEEELTALQKKAAEIAAKYECLPMQDKIGMIAQTFGLVSGRVETTPCCGKWRGTSDMCIRFDDGSSLPLGNTLTRRAKTKQVQHEYVAAVLARYNPEIVAATKEAALAALRKREAKDNAVAAQKGLKPYTVLNVELHQGEDRRFGGYRGWYFVTLAVAGKIHAHLEAGLNYEIAYGKVGERPRKSRYYAAGGLSEDSIDYVFNNVGFSSASGLYSLPLTPDVLERAEKALSERLAEKSAAKPSLREQLALIAAAGGGRSAEHRRQQAVR